MALDLLARRAAGPMRLAAITLIKRVATSEVPQWMGRQIEASRPLMPCPLSLLLIPDSSVLKPLRGGGSAAALHVGNFDGRWNRSKNININNVLQARADHICVLFVQHPPENTLHGAVSKRSLVVCARTFGNCD